MTPIITVERHGIRAVVNTLDLQFKVEQKLKMLQDSHFSFKHTFPKAPTVCYFPQRACTKVKLHFKFLFKYLGKIK